ncbi:MAG TPA: hypothetical protein VHV55_28480 [Pirellulales bacterium]|jgi:hypothetical protein|nr:hypothetical protein [Pirellulales bacterium]
MTSGRGHLARVGGSHLRAQRSADLSDRAAGFEPGGEIDATDTRDCGCEFCQGYRAARALQTGRSNCVDLALLDAELQQLISAWSRLSIRIRRAIMALTAVK